MKDWDLKLPHAKFAYNRAPLTLHYTHLFNERIELGLLLPLTCCPFQVIHDDKVRANEMKKLYEQIRGHIEKPNVVYKARENKHRKAPRIQAR